MCGQTTAAAMCKIKCKIKYKIKRKIKAGGPAARAHKDLI